MGYVLRARQGPVLILTLNRPAKYNAFDAPAITELASSIHTAVHEKANRALVITGSGRAFCAGADIDALARSLRGDPKVLLRELVKHLHAAILDLRECSKPVVAALNGVAAGGGLGLALACDLRIASEQARLKPAYMGAGVVPDGGTTFFLPRIVGLARAAEILLGDEEVDVWRAHELGIVQRIVPPAQLLPTAVAVANQLAGMPAFAVEKTKVLLDQTFEKTLRDQLRDEARWNVESGDTEEFARRVRSFARRKQTK